MYVGTTAMFVVQLHIPLTVFDKLKDLLLMNVIFNDQNSLLLETPKRAVDVQTYILLVE